MKLFLTGGFLGSGKTTAIRHACLELMRRGVAVAVITNDQGEQLVDSEFIRHVGIPVLEVTNGCFCCNYRKLEENIQTLVNHYYPQIIFAESVGSCADLVATITRPLAKFHPDIPVVLSVFADASLLWSLMNGNSCFLDESVQYIYKKQLEEADIIIVNKSDLLAETELEKVTEILKTDYPGKDIILQNSLQREDIQDWLDDLENFVPPMRKALTIDYDIYGEGEKRLAWLDKEIMIRTEDNSAGMVCEALISHIYAKINAANLPIGHIKFFMDDGVNQKKISYTTINQQGPTPLNLPLHANDITMLINARVQSDPALLETLIDEAENEIATRTGSTILVKNLSAFQPGYPTPTYRMADS
jgi:Ni2+-binding GTPase involved in maturation of urease and hydrogenase